ncbi:MAG: GGDEF domain-containing protein [Rhodoferax sp.]|nr:GGDEF domain-containing protein [Rhodoferax sp.]
MRLDPDTLLIVNLANLLVMATTLPLIMGAELSDSARAARRALMIQAVSWIALILSGFWPGTWIDWSLSTLAMVCISAANWLIFLALQGWLGRRPYGRTLAVLALVMPVGYMLGFSSYPFRVGWSNLLIALQFLILAIATLRSNSALGGRWRWVMMGCMLTMAALTAARGVMGAWFTALYPSFTAPHPINLAALLAANVALVLINVAVLVAWREEAEHQLRRQAITDQLTGVCNRHGWQEAAGALVAQAQRYRLPLTLVAIDIDHFKQINDTRGHEAGDAALGLFGRLLGQGQRSGDVIARMGGEEFCVLLPHGDATAGEGFDRRMRALLAAEAPAMLGYSMNFSSGLAVLDLNGESLESLMSRADAAVYRAKQGGRGQLVVALPYIPRPFVASE